MLRIDHFIGLSRYWEIPAGSPTAIGGRWQPGPGAALLEAARAALGDLAIVAEDLGDLTPEVEALRDHLGLPGMKVLQFAFGSGPANRFLPHHYSPGCVVYTGTHDNDTTVGWFATAPEDERAFARRYLASDGADIAWDLIRLAMSSVADTVVVPVQDVLGLGSEARMNRPGLADGNWGWRLRAGALGEAHAARLRELIDVFGREPAVTPPS